MLAMFCLAMSSPHKNTRELVNELAMFCIALCLPHEEMRGLVVVFVKIYLAL